MGRWIREHGRKGPRRRIQPLHAAQIQADVDGPVGAFPQAEDGVGLQAAVAAGVNGFPAPVRAQSDQAAFPGTQPEVSPAVPKDAVDHVRACCDVLELAVEAVGPEHAGTVRSQIEALRRFAEGKDVVGAAYIIMHHGRRTRRIAGQAQLEVAHPYDVVPVDVKGYQVVARQGEQSGGIVRHLLAGAIGPELEEAFVAGGEPGVAGGVLGDGGDAVELAGGAGEEFLFPALGGRIVEEVVRAVGVEPEAAALVGVQSGDVIGGQGAVGFGAGDFFLVSGAQVGPEKPRVR